MDHVTIDIALLGLTCYAFVAWQLERREGDGWMHLYERAARELHDLGKSAPAPTAKQAKRLSGGI